MISPGNPPEKKSRFPHRPLLRLFTTISEPEDFPILILLLIVLLLVFGGGGGYYGYRSWGYGGGAGEEILKQRLEDLQSGTQVSRSRPLSDLLEGK
jgi:hypothetical protein